MRQRRRGGESDRQNLKESPPGKFGVLARLWRAPERSVQVVREHRSAAKTKPKPEIAGRRWRLRYRGWGESSSPRLARECYTDGRGARLLLGLGALTMNTLTLSVERRVVTWCFGALSVLWLAAGCSSNDGVGDILYFPAGGAGGSAGTHHSKAGAPSAGGGVGGSSDGSAGSLAGSRLNGGAGTGSHSGETAAGGRAPDGSNGGALAGGTSGGLGSAAGAGGRGNPISLCGNGRVDPGEQCDSGMLSTSDGGTSGGVAGAGAGPIAKYGELCSNTCEAVGSEACLACEKAQGQGLEDNCLGVKAPFNAAEQAACFAVMRCIQKSNCFDGTGTFGTKCYCGSLTISACSGAPYTGAGSPDGPCVKEIQAGFPTVSSNAVVLGELTYVGYPSGAAMLRLGCQRGCNMGECADKCGFTIGGPAFP